MEEITLSVTPEELSQFPCPFESMKPNNTPTGGTPSQTYPTKHKGRKWRKIQSSKNPSSSLQQYHNPNFNTFGQLPRCFYNQSNHATQGSIEAHIDSIQVYRDGSINAILTYRGYIGST